MNELIDDINFGEFQTFQVFQSKADLLDLVELLEKHEIQYETTDYRLDFISAVNADRFSHEFVLKLREEDFERVSGIISDEANLDLQHLPNDYYLLSYSTEELMEVLRKKDEWNPFDYNLATKLLLKHGIGISEEDLERYQLARIERLSQPQKASSILLLSGYVFAFVGGFIGLLTSIYLITSKKVLPNGEKVYTFQESDRKHGKVMRVISIVFAVITLLIQIKVSAFFWLEL